MEPIIEQLSKLGYDVTFQYDPMRQIVEYMVYCKGELEDIGEADELSWGNVLKRLCDKRTGADECCACYTAA